MCFSTCFEWCLTLGLHMDWPSAVERYSRLWGAFKSTMLKKEFCSCRPGNHFPLLRPLSNHFGLLATFLTAHSLCRDVLCVCLYAVECACCNSAILRPYIFFGLVCGWVGVSHPDLKAVERKLCEAFCFRSHWQEGKGWERQPAQMLSPRSLF